MDAPHPPPETIDVDRARSVTLTWSDGHVSRFGLEELRVNCPCAFCRNLRDQGRVAWAGGELSVAGAELVGNWGLQLRWNDGHQTGIYPWDVLRDWCSCSECAGPSDGSG